MLNLNISTLIVVEMSKKNFVLPKQFKYLFLSYLTGIAFFTLFRLVLFFLEIGQAANLPGKTGLLLQAFFMGFRFDTVIACYILAVPAILLSGAAVFSVNNKVFYGIVHYFIVTFFMVSFFICAADIPYFKYYYSRITIAILNWIDSPVFVLKMVFEEIKFFGYFIVFLFVSAIYVYIQNRIKKEFLYKQKNGKSASRAGSVIASSLISLVVFALIFLGIRGRVDEKSPIRVGTAFFSNYSFPNQLGLNPVFTFMRSYFDSTRKENQNFKPFADSVAVNNAAAFLGASGIKDFPIARVVNTIGAENKANVVVVIMESMSAEKLTRFGNKNNLTRTLDSLAQISYCFDNVYTAGIHTRNGIYSTLFSYPAILRQHPMDKVVVPQFTGFSNTLIQHGYQTVFFTTHDEQFDNIGGFLNSNSFQKVYSKKDYPSDKIMSTLGVTDDYLFEFAVPRLSNLAKDGKPFFAGFMTASDHGPYVIPNGIPFKPHSTDIQQKIIEYADWSIGKFLKLASTQPWYKNTIFVFVADHGAVVGNNVYDMPLSFSHSPLIIYSPMFKEAKVLKQIGGQIDIFPTVMGLLNIPYVNNTFGIDLLKESRPYIFFSNDDKIGCIDNNYFYEYRCVNNDESLYKYRNKDINNYAPSMRAKADSMRTYAFSMMQSAQWLIANKKVGIVKK